MKNLTKNEHGFTLIELVMVIAVIGVLSAAAIPIFQDLVDDANKAARSGVIGAVRSGIYTTYTQTLADPAVPDAFVSALDIQANGPCVVGCFDKVLAYPVTDGTWSKNNFVYTHVSTGVTATYNPASGSFR